MGRSRLFPYCQLAICAVRLAGNAGKFWRMLDVSALFAERTYCISTALQQNKFRHFAPTRIVSAPVGTGIHKRPVAVILAKGQEPASRPLILRP